MIETVTWTEQDLISLGEGLTADNLAAIMRSTWTWDDRALRRDLALILTDLSAVASLKSGTDLHRLARARTYISATHFLGAVLGPRVISDSGHRTGFTFAPTLLSLPGLIAQSDDRTALTSLGSEVYERLAGQDPAEEESATFDGRTLVMHALAASGNRGDALEWSAKIESDDLQVTLAAAEVSGSWDPALVRTRAELVNSQWFLDGEKFFVPFAESVDQLFVIARSTAGPSLFVVDTRSSGVSISETTTIDDSRALARVALSQAPATLIGMEGAGGRIVARTLDLAVVSLAREQLSGARRALRLCPDNLAVVGLAKPEILKLLGEMEVERGIAQASYNHATEIVDGDPEKFSIAAAMAHISCSRMFTSITARIAALMLSEEGSESEDALRIFARAEWSELLFGGPALYYERLLERIGV